MADDLRRGGVAQRDQVVERNHLVGGGAHIELTDIFCSLAKVLIGLNVDPVRAVVEVEVVDVDRSHVDLQGIGDLCERDAEGLCFFTIDLDGQLRIARRKAGEEPGERGVLVALGGDRMRHAIEVL
jgi:hypothetical protein